MDHQFYPIIESLQSIIINNKSKPFQITPFVHRSSILADNISKIHKSKKFDKQVS